MRERAVPLTLLNATLGFESNVKKGKEPAAFNLGGFMSVKRGAIGLVISAFVFLTLAPLFSATAFAQQRDCGPNSNKCKVHHESCTC